MITKSFIFTALITCLFFMNMGYSQKNNSFDIRKQLDYCAVQASKTLTMIPNDGTSPRSIPTGSKDWKFVDYKDWTSGFWPGELWYLYEATGDKKWEKEADKFSRFLTPLSVNKANDHDLGFQIFNSFGNGYLLTKNAAYKDIILKTADTLATLFNPKVGTIQSWPHNKMGGHNTIIDNMMNLELLFWASKNGGNKKLYDIAVKHAETTMNNHFRPDYTSYHVLIYDYETGKKIKGRTAQGYSDDSMWARGQAWAIYGFTMTYRETKDPKFLDFAHKVARVYLDKLTTEDLIPYWDFNAPNIPNEPKDASAAAIVSSALIELSSYTKDKKLKNEYLSKSKKMIVELSGHYQSHEVNSAFLLHSTGHKPAGSEIDCSINYADYYYLEALLRLQKLK
ncbi:glycoside hydrolase family 88 protein [Flavobacterium sp. MMLR14_040]|uniref:glycoside hydrolase family 88 protein n=1 Tax=Flavobacterium sp. MMLR14_040 TaxID=3093843 RepID=UPI0029905707|nr:glycoside hydrolase family 88 protein [Flavobacterium sp. MMLR14_040]MDW8851100.1 glycoside hydrolase family 88 protein [Flavobacterium sp. MMLR14_040]